MTEIITSFRNKCYKRLRNKRNRDRELNELKSGRRRRFRDFILNAVKQKLQRVLDSNFDSVFCV